MGQGESAAGPLEVLSLVAYATLSWKAWATQPLAGA